MKDTVIREWKKRMLRLRMERQHLIKPAGPEAYDTLYRDMQPGQNLYWHGFGEPPVLSFRADFDDVAYNRSRRESRALVKGRFQGGNLGWIMAEEMELFVCVYQKPLTRYTVKQDTLLKTIRQMGPMNIQRMKEETGMLVKEITPALHRLQEAFLIYEDQYDGEWDRAWYRFEEMFPEVNPEKYTRIQALKIILKRFACRMVWFTLDMAKSFYKLPVKDIKRAAGELVEEGELIPYDGGYLLPEDLGTLERGEVSEELTGPAAGVLVMHRNDMLVKTFEYKWKDAYKDYIARAKGRHPEASDFDILYLLLMDGEIHGAVLGKFKYGPYIIEDIVVDDTYAKRREEIVTAVCEGNPGSTVMRFMGRPL